MKYIWILTVAIGAFLLEGLAPVEAADQTIMVRPLTASPVIDGGDGDWSDIQATIIPVSYKNLSNEVWVKAGVFGDTVYFLWQWEDSSEDSQHKPFLWDRKANKYTSSSYFEDRFAVNFAMDGDFTHDWFSGKTFKADMWHWKAFRSNTIGLAHDKMTIISTEPLKAAYKVVADNNSTIYISRPSDKGDKLYSTKRYATRQNEVMPKYIMTIDPKGSIADVKAKGVWRNGTWTLEESRLLNTGNADDAVFKPGESIASAVAVFDHAGDENHYISSTIVFQFPQ